MEEQNAKQIFYKILLGCSHMHKTNIIHRDLKLENIFVKFTTEKVDLNQIDEIKLVDVSLGQKSSNKPKNFDGNGGTPN